MIFDPENMGIDAFFMQLYACKNYFVFILKSNINSMQYAMTMRTHYTYIYTYI